MIIKGLDKIKLFCLDMDGTIYVDNKLFPGVLETIKLMRKQGNILFLTNNSSKSSSYYIEKLAKLNISINEKEIFTSGQATIMYLQKNYPNKKVYLLGNKLLVEEFITNGIILDEVNPDCIVLSYDNEIDYRKMVLFNNFLLQGKPYIATHPDLVCPASPYFVPDIGSYIALFEKSSQRSPDIIIGKPYSGMKEAIMAKFNLKEEEIAMVGDRLYTDIAFANNCHFKSILVLSGETTIKDYNESTIQADYVLNGISDLFIK